MRTSRFVLMALLLTSPCLWASGNLARPEVGLVLHYEAGNQIGASNFGAGVLGNVRLSRLFSAGLEFDYTRNTRSNLNWYQILIQGDFHIADPEEKLDPFLGFAVGDSAYNGEQGIAVRGRVGADYWLKENLAASLVAGVAHGFNIATQNHPDYTSGFFSAGVKYQF